MTRLFVYFTVYSLSLWHTLGEKGCETEQDTWRDMCGKILPEPAPSSSGFSSCQQIIFPGIFRTA